MEGNQRDDTGLPKRTRQRMQLQAIANGWLQGLTAEKLGKVAEKAYHDAMNAKTERDRARSMKILVEITKQIMEQEKREQGIPEIHEHRGMVGVSIEDLRREVLNEPEFVEYRRQSAVDADAGTDGESDQPRPLGDGQAPRGT